MIQNAIDLLENQNDACIVQDIKTGDSKKIFLSDVIYGEYLERNIFLYTKDDTCSLKLSLIKFIEQCPNYFIQISQSILLNIYFIDKFTSKVNGNMKVTTTYGEVLIVSRRYMKNLKATLVKISNL